MICGAKMARIVNEVITFAINNNYVLLDII